MLLECGGVPVHFVHPDFRIAVFRQQDFKLQGARFIFQACLVGQQQSYDLFRNQCYQDEGNAKQQAARGTYDPAYLNYTMGKLMIRKLRDYWAANKGGEKAWKAFHDQFLSYGGPPIPLVRQQMMGGKAEAVF